MKRINLFFLFVPLLFITTGCGSGGDYGSFPMNKRYWTAEDYRDVNRELNTLKVNEKQLPNLSDPKTAPIFKKMIDTANITVVASDDQLGTKHRAEFTSDMFYQYKDLHSGYSDIDRQDKYVYPAEFVEILKFGLCLQLHYIKTTNENIRKDADNPEADDVLNVLNRNWATLINNYTHYLDFINYEERFNESALNSYSEGIRDFYPRLFANAPPDSGYYTSMAEKIDNMMKKSKNQSIIAELQTIQSLISSKVAPTK